MTRHAAPHRRNRTPRWAAADQFLAESGLKPSEYATPVLGLLFLRQAESRFAAARATHGGGQPRRGGVAPEDYKVQGSLYLPPEARFPEPLKLPDSANLMVINHHGDEAMKVFQMR